MIYESLPRLRFVISNQGFQTLPPYFFRDFLPISSLFLFFLLFSLFTTWSFFLQLNFPSSRSSLHPLFHSHNQIPTSLAPQENTFNTTSKVFPSFTNNILRHQTTPSHIHSSFFIPSSSQTFIFSFFFLSLSISKIRYHLSSISLSSHQKRNTLPRKWKAWVLKVVPCIAGGVISCWYPSGATGKRRR